jgi:hypothetical protein
LGTYGSVEGQGPRGPVYSTKKATINYFVSDSRDFVIVSDGQRIYSGSFSVNAERSGSNQYIVITHISLEEWLRLP